MQALWRACCLWAPRSSKFHSAIVTDNAVGGFFVTTGRFTKEAIEFAKSSFIELIDAKALARLMYASKPAAVDNDSYRSKCCTCGAVVTHSLRTAGSVTCQNGHEVAPTLDLKTVFSKDDYATERKFEREMELLSLLQPPAYVMAPAPPIDWKKGQQKLAAVISGG